MEPQAKCLRFCIKVMFLKLKYLFYFKDTLKGTDNGNEDLLKMVDFNFKELRLYFQLEIPISKLSDKRCDSDNSVATLVSNFFQVLDNTALKFEMNVSC